MKSVGGGEGVLKKTKIRFALFIVLQRGGERGSPIDYFLNLFFFSIPEENKKKKNHQHCERKNIFRCVWGTTLTHMEGGRATKKKKKEKKHKFFLMDL